MKLLRSRWGFFVAAMLFVAPAVVAAPTATTGPATNIGSTSATLNATVNPGGASTQFYFQYGTNTGYGSISTVKTLAAGSVDVLTNASINGLLVNATYHYRAVATNSTGTNFGNDLMFTTLVAIPTITSVSAGSIGTTNATLSGNVNPGGDVAAYFFQYGTTTNYGSSTPINSLAAGSANVSVSNVVNGLGPGLDYHYRLVATNSAGTKVGSDLAFSTFSPPTLSNVSAVCVAKSTELISATVNLGHTNIYYWIQFGHTLSYGSNTPPTFLGLRNAQLKSQNIQEVTFAVTGLDPDSLYHFRMVATNSFGTFIGDDQTFATVSTPPFVTTNADSGGGSLRNAIADAPGGATILFDPGLSGATIVLTTGELFINTNLNIDASSLAQGIVVDGNQSSRVFDVSGANVVLTSLIISNGLDSQFNKGGGLYSDGLSTLTLNRCTVTGNTVNPNFVDSGGGGIFSVGTLTLNQCTVSGNEVNPQVGGPGGGGIYVYAGTATLNECTLSENLDFVGNNSSAILNSGTLRLNQCTISGNLEDSGIHNFFNAGAGASILVTNCIIAGNGEDIRVDSGTTVTFRGSNIVQSLNNQGTVVGTPINAAPNLAPLGNYGGPTQTMPPLPGSPAIDTGSDSATNTFAFDQRGLARLQGLHVDIGAVEGGYNTGGPGKLKNFLWIGNGSSRFGFTNFTGMSFTVLASTNPALPLNSWSVLGPAVESPAGSGQYQFTDPAATNHPSRFYSVRSP